VILRVLFRAEGVRGCRLAVFRCRQKTSCVTFRAGCAAAAEEFFATLDPHSEVVYASCGHRESPVQYGNRRLSITRPYRNRPLSWCLDSLSAQAQAPTPGWPRCLPSARAAPGTSRPACPKQESPCCFIPSWALGWHAPWLWQMDMPRPHAWRHEKGGSWLASSLCAMVPGSETGRATRAQLCSSR
jgi:hypothetical protein